MLVILTESFSTDTEETLNKKMAQKAMKRPKEKPPACEQPFKKQEEKTESNSKIDVAA